MSGRHDKTILFTLCFFLLAACGAPTQDIQDVFESSGSCESSAVPKQFLVQWKNGKVTVEKADSKQAFFEKMNGEASKILRAERNHFIALPPPVADQTGNPVTLNDSSVNWGIEAIEAESVWTQARGAGITVAVIDSGVEISHPQLTNQLHINTVEANGVAGVDDDGNGLIDDINGWDFVANTGNVTEALEGDSHGTHVAGVIAAEHSGSGNVKGVAPEAKILPLNFMDAERGGTIDHALAAIDYAVAQGAKIINASWGSSGCSSILEGKVAELTDKNVLFVAAAGNSGNNISFLPEFPASFQFSHQITVGATTDNGFRPGFSNFSNQLVHLLAPGFEIISTIASDDSRASKSGTSMAAPFVSGAAAVLWSALPSATPAQIHSALVNSVDPSHPGAAADTISGGSLNLRKAYNLLTGSDI